MNARKLILFGSVCMAVAVAFPALASSHGVVESWEDLALGLWHTVAEYAGGPAVVAFLMAQLRAMFPMLGKLGVVTMLGDLIAGNWGAAKNAK